MRSCLFLLLCLSFALSAYAGESITLQAPNGSATPLQSDDQKILYVLGQVLGRDIQSAGLTEAELASVLLGLTDSALRRPAQVNVQQYGPQLQAFMDAHVKVASAAELTQSQAFIDQQAKIQGAVRTPSGIVIRELKAGTGPTPTAEDTVRVHYHGTLRDGSVFDSSVQRGQPATFPLKNVIPCWTEAVQQIHVGGKAQLTCPPNLAYGEDGRPGIPGNAVLVFEVELLEIVRN